MKTVRLTTAQALVRFLDNQYVEFDGREQKFVRGVFAIFGHGNVLGIGQALEQSHCGLELHMGRNEQGMAHAAIGYAKQMKRKQIFACTSSVGPGAANMVTAAATATANRIPVLFLPGDVYATRQPDPVLQQMEQFDDLTLSTNDAYRAVCKYWDRISRPEQLMSAAVSAMRVLTDPANTGAVCLALPQDVEGEAYDFPEYFFAKRVHRIERQPATEPMIKDAVSLIKRKKHPILICGGGVRYSEAEDTFRAFAEKFNIPFGETQAGKSAIEWTHPLNLGGIGTTGELAANNVASDADLVIGVGTRYTDFTTASKFLFQNPDVEFLNINVASFDAYKMDGVRVIADAKAALEAIEKELGKCGYRSGYTDEIKKAKNAWIAELDRLDGIKYTGPGFKPEIEGHMDEKLSEYSRTLGSDLTQTRVLGLVNSLIDDDAVVVGASGSLPGDMQRVWRPMKPDTYHMEYGYSCMGYEINAAFGVKMARPDKEVYAFVGDGAYMMLHSELITSIAEHRKINVLLFDNMSFGCINNLEMEQGMGSYGTEFRSRDPKTGELSGGLVKMDFAMSARACGCKGYTVHTEEELRSAIEDSKKQDVSTLIDIKVLPKTMTHGYKAWWRCGVAQVSQKESVRRASENMQEHIDKARRY